jgi:hypothetical protein
LNIIVFQHKDRSRICVALPGDKFREFPFDGLTDAVFALLLVALDQERELEVMTGKPAPARSHTADGKGNRREPWWVRRRFHVVGIATRRDDRRRFLYPADERLLDAAHLGHLPALKSVCGYHKLKNRCCAERVLQRVDGWLEKPIRFRVHLDGTC